MAVWRKRGCDEPTSSTTNRLQTVVKSFVCPFFAKSACTVEIDETTMSTSSPLMPFMSDDLRFVPAYVETRSPGVWSSIC